MAKANRKAIESSNFWDGHWVHGRYTAKPKVNAGDIKVLHKAKKDRLRKEQRFINMYRRSKNYILYDEIVKLMNKMSHDDKPTKIQKAHDQIQYGFDIANWWNEQHA